MSSPAIGEDEARAIERVYGALGGFVEGFRPIEQQRRMIGAVAEAFAGERISLVEAPTGVGKTVAYLVPGMVLAALRGKRLIVSTATTALQDQLARKDVQAVAAAMRAAGMEAPAWAVAKGRERYVCVVRLEQQAIAPGLFDRRADGAVLKDMREALAGGSWNGERDAWGKSLDGGLWRRVANTRHTCLGSRCREAANCSYFAAVGRAEAASVVIANHDLVLTSLARAERSAFADFEANLFVFDEAHHLGAKALGAFAHRTADAADWTHDFPALLARTGAVQFRRAAQLETKKLAGVLAALRVAFDALAGEREIYRFPLGVIPAQVRSGAEQACAILERLLEYVAGAEQATQDEHQRIALGAVGGQIETAAEAWLEFARPDEGKPRARWVERDGERWIAVASPFDAAPILRGMLWKHCAGAALTSATLAPLGSFEATLVGLGLAEDERVATLRLDSPFDYSRARLRVPRMRASPKEAPAHTEEVARYVRIVAAGADGGVLVLFSSVKQLRDVLAMMDETLRAEILVQGELTVSEILARNRERIAAGKRSVIFGLASFAEGIDLPGKLCTRVVIAKIPFPAPEEPLIAAESEWLERKGLRSFPLVMLPRGATRLVQAVGRLIRSNADWGEVVILDRRLVEMRYGEGMQRVLPMRTVIA